MYKEETSKMKAKEKITCYKVVREFKVNNNNDDMAYQPLMGSNYLPLTIIEGKQLYDTAKEEESNLPFHIEGQWIRSYDNLEEALQMAEHCQMAFPKDIIGNISGCHHTVYECVIPKGTTYEKEYDTIYHSKKLRFIKPLHSYDVFDLCNIRKAEYDTEGYIIIAGDGYITITPDGNMVRDMKHKDHTGVLFNQSSSYTIHDIYPYSPAGFHHMVNVFTSLEKAKEYRDKHTNEHIPSEVWKVTVREGTAYVIIPNEGRIMAREAMIMEMILPSEPLTEECRLEKALKIKYGRKVCLDGDMLHMK